MKKLRLKQRVLLLLRLMKLLLLKIMQVELTRDFNRASRRDGG
jgi:hypothetical protein